MWIRNLLFFCLIVDLVVGAFGSQSVFVLRSRPFASVQANISADISPVEGVKLDSFSCKLGNLYYTCFQVQIFAWYTGKGIADEFSTKVMVRETSRPRRIQFGADFTSSASISVPITFYGQSNLSSVFVTAYVRNGTTSLEDFVFSAEVLNIERSESIVVDTTTVPSDLSALPVIQADSLSLDVAVFAECGPDRECMSDLQLVLTNITYISRTAMLSQDQSRLVVDDVEFIEVSTAILNSDEDAFNTFVEITIPTAFFVFDQVMAEGARIVCEEITSPGGDGYDVRRCNIRSPLSSSFGAVPLRLSMAVKSLIGDEGSASILMSVSVGLNSTRNSEPMNRLGNNDIDIVIPIAARSVFTVSGSFSSNAVTYQGNHTPSVDNDASNLGNPLGYIATFRNEGPSTIQSATFVLYIPTNSSITGEYYFYYPAELSLPSSNIECTMDGINPEGYRTDKRKKRSIRRRRGLTRVARQLEIAPSVDCEMFPDSCVKISCNITNLGLSSVDVNIVGYLDERFYNRKDDPYLLRAYVAGDVVESYFETEGSVTNQTFSVSLSLQTIADSSSNIPPWYIIAAPIAAALIFIAILAVALYFFGFFKRKQGGKEVAEGDDEFDQFDSNPFGNRGTAPAVGASLGDPELTKYEQKGKEE